MLRNLFKDSKGSMATIFAIGGTTLIMGVGAAIEVSALVKKRDLLQDVADSAVLAAAVSDETIKEELEKVAIDAATANYDGEFSLKLEKNGREIVVDLTTNHDMIMMGMFGYDTRPVKVMSASEAGVGGKMNFALALDTTLSMEGSRMDAMIDAASDLIDSVKMADKEGGNAKISLIPFADYVRIDMGYGEEPWIDVQPDHESSWNVLDEDASTNCRKVGSGETETTECDVEIYETRTAMITWNGCMVSRPGDLHRYAAYDGNAFKANAGHTSCGSSNNIITPLSDDFSSLKSELENYNAHGKTYLPVGLQWAWRALDEAALFTDEDIDSDEPVQKILLLMTDGSNTVSLNGESSEADGWEGVYHYGTGDEDENREAADILTLEMCTSIKASDIRLITVAYEVTDSDTREMLKACASANSDFYDARNASTLKKAFGKIGSGFSTARLTR